MRVAILDLGTNTFNLLVAEITDKKEYKILGKSVLIKRKSGLTP
jgi:exopolyphosphatase/pppGpp-phosphohydrolase